MEPKEIGQLQRNWKVCQGETMIDRNISIKLNDWEMSIMPHANCKEATEFLNLTLNVD